MTAEPKQERTGITGRWSRLSLLLMVVGLGSLVAAGLFLVFGVLGGGSDYEGPGTAEAFGPPLTYYQTAEPDPTVVPTTPPSAAPLAHISIPRFDVEVPVIVLGIDADGAMETPEGPWEVAWYDFTARPGAGSNAVFSGHVDALYTGSPGPAAFWNLKDLEQGDLIEVKLADGTVYRYAVVSRWSVDGDTSEVGPIIGRTEKDVITLITCGGNLGTTYDQRLIVRAERVLENAAADALPSTVGSP